MYKIFSLFSVVLFIIYCEKMINVRTLHTQIRVFIASYQKNILKEQIYEIGALDAFLAFCAGISYNLLPLMKKSCN